MTAPQGVVADLFTGILRKDFTGRVIIYAAITGTLYNLL
jgi:hypothetical protein